MRFKSNNLKRSLIEITSQKSMPDNINQKIGTDVFIADIFIYEEIKQHITKNFLLPMMSCLINFSFRQEKMIAVST